jgi:hypothetical protein
MVQIKAADDRSGDVAALERLLDRPDVPAATRKRIEAELRQIQAGALGEKDAAYEIEFWFGRSKNWATIHDLRIEVDGLVAQIDHILINRLAEVWVCESKHFAEGVSVNNHGEWSRWRRGRSVGMPSPIEQNRKHIRLLEQAFDEGLVPLPRRLGLVSLKPSFRSLVLVSNNARIGRPKRTVDGLDEVIKADQLKTWLFDEFDRTPPWKVAGLIGTQGLEKLARDLVQLHRAASFDWAARFGLPPEPLRAARAPGVPAAAAQSTPEKKRGSGHRWARCGEGVSFAVVRFCWNNKPRFGGSVYCMTCQSAF